jgi:hypothetical protein
LRGVRKISQIADWVVADAVAIEPVSASKFPFKAEKPGNPPILPVDSSVALGFAQPDQSFVGHFPLGL